MIYTIEKRAEFDSVIMDTHYEVRQYERRTSIGVLVNGKTLKKCKSKIEALEYCGRRGIAIDE